MPPCHSNSFATLNFVLGSGHLNIVCGESALTSLVYEDYHYSPKQCQFCFGQIEGRDRSRVLERQITEDGEDKGVEPLCEDFSIDFVEQGHPLAAARVLACASDHFLSFLSDD